MSTAADSHVHLFRPGEDGDAQTLLMLHGTGGDEASFAGLGAALAPGAAVLSVRGNVSEHGMSRFFRRLAEGVYDMADLALRTRALGEFVEAALEHYAIDRDRLIGVGYSNGANILANLLFQSPRPGPDRGPDAPADPVCARGPAGPCGPASADHRRRARPDLPAGADPRAPWLFRAPACGRQLIFHAGGHELQPASSRRPASSSPLDPARRPRCPPDRRMPA